MISRSNRRRFSISSAITRRWIRSRPGSVLILVIALLVLLALIGTAYLSSTQTERYTSVQNTINTQADLLVDGLIINLEGRITNGLYGNSGQDFRPPTPEISADNTAIPVTGYNPYTSPASDDFLSERIPTLYNGYPSWHGNSWSPFPDTSGFYTADSPFDDSLPLTNIANKTNIITFPTSRTLNGQTYPAMLYYVPPSSLGTVIPTTNGLNYTVSKAGGYLTLINGVPTVSLTAPTPVVAASASGDGIADASLFKIPIGPINGITYFGSIRVVDNNSAVNVSTAWTAAVDPPVSGIGDSTLADATAKTANHGFFRSNVGLRELLNTTTELDNLNAYRFNNGTFIASQSPVNPSPVTASPGIGTTPRDESGAALTTFSYYSTTGLPVDVLAGDPIEMMLARRLGNPGFNTATQHFVGFGNAQSAALAQRFSLTNAGSNPSVIEQLLPYETLYNKGSGKLFPHGAYSPTQVISTSLAGNGAPVSSYWYDELFNFTAPFVGSTNYVPIRTLLTASNPVSNGVSSHFDNTNTGGTLYSSTSTYKFGDWVTFKDPAVSTTPFGGTTNSFVCLQPIITPGGGGDPPTLSIARSTPYWAYVPWKYQPTKASVNTSTFEQLWLNFCHVMTDTVPMPTTGDVTKAATVPQWQPPLMPTQQVGAYYEEQMPQFRSVIRDNRAWPQPNAVGPNTGQPSSTGGQVQSKSYTTRVQLTPMQMMQLRAAIAAINTVSIRNVNANPATRVTRSRRITLPDINGNPAFDVEVFGQDIQPFIGQMYAQIGAPNNFIAIQLLNPYTDADITITNAWKFATIDRTLAAADASLSLTNSFSPTATITVPKATVGANGMVKPGMVTIYEGTPPGQFTLPPGTSASVALPGLAQTIGHELVILKPRNGATVSTVSNTLDVFDENNDYDLVPCDQIDMTGVDTAAAPNNNIYYRRGADPLTVGGNGATFAWNFVWPGFYAPYNDYNVGRQVNPPGSTPLVLMPKTVYPYAQQMVANGTVPTATNPDFTLLCGGAADVNVATAIAPTYNTVTLQLNNTSLPGANPITNAPADRFPFGGFARSADLLQIPFIGAYRISDHNKPLSDLGKNATHVFYEMNSVTMDSSLANDSTLQQSSTNSGNYNNALKLLSSPSGYTMGTPAVTVTADGGPTDSYVEQIGHFVPIGGDNSPTTYANGTPPVSPSILLDFGTESTNPWQYWHYHWTKKLFDYFTVNATHDDYFPNVDPDLDYVSYGAATKKYTGALISVANSIGATPNVGEDLTGVEGLININTAPWPVLSTLPFVPRRVTGGPLLSDGINYDTTSGKTELTTTVGGPGSPANVDDNVDIAKAIVAYRNANGPFKSIMDLNNVPAFRLENDAILSGKLVTPNVTEPGAGQGDFSPGGLNPLIPTTDGARFDFEERFILFTQISSLITTRSDTFTCYVDLQGWRNVGTGNPTLAVERRKAFLFDRNSYAPAYKNPSYFQVPGN